jgi:hypothetical protein
MVDLVVAIVVMAVLAGVLVLSTRLTGLVAENFGEDPQHWQLRMLPFALFGPIIAWLLLSRRAGGGRGGWA